MSALSLVVARQAALMLEQVVAQALLLKVCLTIGAVAL